MNTSTISDFDGGSCSNFILTIFISFAAKTEANAHAHIFVTFSHCSPFGSSDYYRWTFIAFIKWQNTNHEILTKPAQKRREARNGNRKSLFGPKKKLCLTLRWFQCPVVNIFILSFLAVTRGLLPAERSFTWLGFFFFIFQSAIDCDWMKWSLWSYFSSKHFFDPIETDQKMTFCEWSTLKYNFLCVLTMVLEFGICRAEAAFVDNYSLITLQP